MKQINLYTGLFLILFTSSFFTACDKEESLFDERDVTSGMYEFNVTSAGFAPAEGQSSENAKPINIPFGNDDAMGVVMIDGDKITHTRYIYKELLDKWSGDLVVKNPSAKIFAYYPYDEKLEISSLNTQGANASEVFNQMIAGFVPETDQSEAENFRKSNLMVGVASLDEVRKEITINMESAMALAVVKVDPNQEGIMSLESDPDYKWNVDGISTESLAPFYKFAENTFISYIIPEKEQTVSTSSGRVIVCSISKSTYQECKLSLIHKLQVGDFFMKDGSLLGKDATLTDEQKDNCIGIVFQTDENRIGDAEKTALGGKAHGLVLALKNIGNSSTYKFSIKNDDIAGIVNSETLDECYNDINGLANTEAVYNLDNYATDYPLFAAVKSFNDENNRPKKTTEWFLPSIGQFWDLLINLGGAPTKNTSTGYEDRFEGYHYWRVNGNKVLKNINAILDGTNSDKFGDVFEQFWLASECSCENPYLYARKVLFNNTDLHFNVADKTGFKGYDSNNNPKYEFYKARPILAF